VTAVSTTALPSPAQGRPSSGRPAGERLAATGALRRVLARPELGAAVAALAILVFFLVMAPSLRTAAGIANVLDASSLLGIMAIPVALLMIGGEFDLSAGVQTASAALLATIVGYQLTLNVWAAVAISLALTLVIGLLNGVLLARTGLPSFIVTLGTFFVLQGLNLAVTKQVTGSVLATGVATLDGWDSVRAVFAGEVPFFGASLKISVVWWLGLTVLGSVLLTRTRAGNWIFAAGGEQNAARQVGVPVTAVKTGVFVWVSGVVVVALIFGMTKQGIPAAQWDNDWYKLFLGVMLLAATVLNTLVRRRATGVRP
jgi:simple sugar transport system permease protein